MTSKLEHALQLAQQGFYVFPCDTETNTPILPWRERSTRNPATIKDWFICPFLGFEQDYNIGVDCYKSGVTVIDVDVKNGKQGRVSYEKWQADYGWGVTRMQTTASGGLHLIYKASGFKNSVEKLAPGIDVRSDGGFYIAAGSTKNGKTYILEHDIEPKPLPDWLSEKLTALGKATEPTARDSGKTIIADDPGDIEAAINFLQNHPPAVEGDGGDIHTYKTFCQLKERGVAIQTAIDLAAEHWNPQCEPPWDHDALIAKANSAYKSAQNATGAKSPLAEFDMPKDVPKAPLKHNFNAPWQAKTPEQIPKRQWVIPGITPAKQLSLWIAEPGVGKSTLSLATALSKASGKAFMGFDPGEPGAVAVFNNEDDTEEMERRLVACMLHYGITKEAIGERIFLNSGEQRRLRIAKKLADGRIVPDDMEKIILYVKENNIKLLIVDPFSETHPAQENSNEEIIKIAAMYRYIAQQTGCAVILIHHTRKPSNASSEGHSGDFNSARGASSLIGVARSVWTLNGMSAKDAERYGISDEDRSFYLIFEQAKANMSAPGAHKKYFKRIGVILNSTGEIDSGESVGVLEPVHFNPVTIRKNADLELIKALEDVLVNAPLTSPLAAEAVCGTPFFCDTQPDTMSKRIRRLMQDGDITTGRGVLKYAAGYVRGKKTLLVSFTPLPDRETPDLSDLI